eukprot:TRINITY_DN6456_c0_g1_i1.p1 TRINITY_DN6456_c0_g1~~TRINITY_DN6456_c0_g1_i1.p1  ORF type:complete len:104 (-),score=26.12 TRINITY_DN6456_c0_g1_i1:456-767(-)
MEERFNRQRKDVTGIEEARRLIKASNGISVDLSGLDLEQIPEELYQLNVLHNLNLSANSLKSLPEDFFPFFSEITILPDKFQSIEGTSFQYWVLNKITRTLDL